MRLRDLSKSLSYPPVAWGLIVVLLFATEYATMLALPVVFGPDPPHLVEALADSCALTAVVAPAVWLLLRPLRDAMRVRSLLLADLFDAVEAERRLTAGALHDGIGQGLSLLISGLRTARTDDSSEDHDRRLLHLEQVAATALADVRRISRGLRPSLLDDLGLAAAIDRLVTDFAAQSDIRFTADVGGLPAERLSEPLETAVFRIVQESLSNIVRHSGAAAAAVTLRRDGDALALQVVDDGHGFDPGALSSRATAGNHMGIVGMRERVTLLGGRLSVDAAPGRGCRIDARFPL
jgi:signal transduction histidine kinase